MTPEERATRTTWQIVNYFSPLLAKGKTLDSKPIWESVFNAICEAVEEEREACARVADEFVVMGEESDGWLGNTGLQKATARRIARLIRMRSKR